MWLCIETDTRAVGGENLETDPVLLETLRWHYNSLGRDDLFIWGKKSYNFIPYTKTSSNWMKNLNMKSKLSVFNAKYRRLSL